MATERCPQCGEPVEQGAAFCPSGHPVRAAWISDEEPRAPVGESTVPPPAAGARGSSLYVPDDDPDLDPFDPSGRRIDVPAGAMAEPPPTVQLPRPVYCSSCGTPNRPSRTRCERCGEPLHPPSALRPARRSPLPAIVLALVALALLSAAVWVFAFGDDRSDAEAPAEPTAAGEPTAADTEVDATPTEPEAQTYVVQSGDSLSAIAQQFGTTVEELAAANGISDPDAITLGQELVIPPAPAATPGEPAATPGEPAGAAPGATPEATP